MTEEEARYWIEQRYKASAIAALSEFATEVIAESTRQNLIASSTIPTIWSRHLLDAAQLVPLAPAEGLWIDIGSGAGLPGLVAAILRPEPTVLVEPRRRRADFLERCVARLGLTNVDVRQVKIESVSITAAVISARAVAPVEKLLHAAAACGNKDTRWLLPRGRTASGEISGLQARWSGLFHMKQSLTDAQSTILICDGPRSR